MFGTVGRAHVRPENREKLREVLTDATYRTVEGYRRGYVMFPENREDEVIIVAMFEDSDSYWKNADDPAQHERYLKFRELLEDDPEWSDGEWLEGVEGDA
jgi:hypothetical protein